MDTLIPKHSKLGEGFSRREKELSYIHPGRRTSVKGYQSPASWISDLLGLKKAICLCSFCKVKFDHRKHHYRKFYVVAITGLTDGHRVNGRCDACKQRMEHCGGGTAYVHESEYAKVCIDPMEARRKARAAAREHSVWAHINQGR